MVSSHRCITETSGMYCSMKGSMARMVRFTACMIPRVFGSFMRVSLFKHLSDFRVRTGFDRLVHTDAQQDEAKCNHVQCADDAEPDAIPEAVVEQISNHPAHHHASNRSSEDHQPGPRDDGEVRDDI